MNVYSVIFTEEEIEALIDLDYYGGEHIYSSWDSDEAIQLMDIVEKAVEKMKMARSDK